MKVIEKGNSVSVRAGDNTRIYYNKNYKHNLFAYSWKSEGKWYYQFAVFGCRGFDNDEQRTNCLKASAMLYRYLRRNNLFTEPWNISFKRSVI